MCVEAPLLFIAACNLLHSCLRVCFTICSSSHRTHTSAPGSYLVHGRQTGVQTCMVDNNQENSELLNVYGSKRRCVSVYLWVIQRRSSGASTLILIHVGWWWCRKERQLAKDKCANAPVTHNRTPPASGFRPASLRAATEDSASCTRQITPDHGW